MSSRTRTRAVKTAAGVHTVRIPRQRGRRAHDAFVVVVPERPSLAREALGFLGRALWRSRRALAPVYLAVFAFTGSALLHVVACWSAVLLASAAAVPLVWLLHMQRRHRARGSVLAWRTGLAVLAASCLAWLALATWLGPLAGPLEWSWLLTLICAQTTWLVVRRTH